MRFAVLFSITICSLLFPAVGTAEITQRVFVGFDPTPANPFSGDEDNDSDLIQGATDSDINRALLANILGDGYSATGSVGEFGNYGVQGQTIRTGEFSAQVIIEADVAAPQVGGAAREAFANFIIDGGSVTFVAGENSNLRFLLTLDSDNEPFPEFQSGFELFGSPGGSSTYMSLGNDMGATFDGNSTVDIPFSFQSVSLGVLSPGQVIHFEYQLDIIANIEGFSEITHFEFQDPLSVQPPLANLDQLRPTISFISAVPEPASCLFLFALGATMCCRRRCR